MSFDFIISESKILTGVKIIKPSIATDLRGNIWTSFSSDQIDRLIPQDMGFVHDKFSESKNNVLRGIHGDMKSWKLVSCVFGEIFQVVVDCRENSPTYKKYQSFNINANNQISILIPPKMGNAYYVKSTCALYHYKLAYSGSYIDADEQFSIKWDDPDYAIKWPTNNPILSGRDRRNEDL
jgi:dTDP-4-dehydrorhamnose 3,5-epimerase